MDADLLDAATRRLYAAPPDEFTGLRNALASEAGDTADAETARAIGRLRKPTNPARVVNALAADDPGVADRLRDLGDRLRGAQHDLDAPRMRELTDERRKLVADCARRALALAEQHGASSTLRDDVLGTFDAAVADPDVATRLGALQRPERFSGFGFADTDGAATPQLTLVQGGRGSERADRSQPAEEPPKITAAERRKRRRARDDAQRRFDTAEAAFDAADTGERDAVRAVSKREREFAKAKDALDAARGQLDQCRDAVKDAKRERREARSALDREQRRAED